MEQSWSSWPTLLAASFVTSALLFSPASPPASPPPFIYVSIAIPWSTHNSLPQTGFFILLCLSVHTTPSAWAALCPPSTCKVMLILPDLAYGVTRLVKPMRSSCLLESLLLELPQLSSLSPPWDAQNSLLTQNRLFIESSAFPAALSVPWGRWRWDPPAYPSLPLEASQWQSRLWRGSWASHWDADVPLFLEQFQRWL